MATKRKVFRTQALKHYAQNRQKDILPQFISLPIFLLLWILLGTVVVAVFLAWQETIPIYTNVSVVILVDQSKSTATGLLFVPSNTPAKIEAGQQITLQVKLTGQPFTTNVAFIDFSAITPDAARAQYHLTGDSWLAIQEPSIVVHVYFTPEQAREMKTDKLNVDTQLQVGSRSLLSSLLDLLKGKEGKGGG